MQDISYYTDNSTPVSMVRRKDCLSQAIYLINKCCLRDTN